MATAQVIATVAAGLFAGAAIYINLAEHPARLECGGSLAAKVFGPSYRRAAKMQVALVLLGTTSGVVAWQGTDQWEWLAGALLLFSVIPFTLVAIMGTNTRLLDPGLDRDSEEARDLLVRWGRLHAVRTVAGLASFLVFVVSR